ncbi:MAG TPA: ribosome biogenesis GTP-binding protein YihA/YsxC [Candidatus Binataceae bacterium]|nr:ribosome biogenesis GTP-binding protein YihA/YsxC [Candidatus Binataceae bacterium]
MSSNGSRRKAIRLEAEFLLSATRIAECPRWQRAEIALAGRSNVGKSSLLNALAGRHNLARTSKTPGRTRSLNFFTVGDKMALVDLPGYGYAQMAHAEAEKIALLMQAYLRERLQLKGFVLLIDARRGPEDAEFTLTHSLRDPPSNKRHLIIVATKWDKLRSAERAAALRRFEPIGTAPLICSSVTGQGIEQLRREILRVALDDETDELNPGM